MPHTLLDSTFVCQSVFLALAQRLTRCGEMHYDPAVGEAKIGTVVNIRIPRPFDPARDLLHSFASEFYIPVTLNQRLRVDVHLSTRDFAFSVAEFMRHYGESVAGALSTKVLRWWPLGSEMVTADLPLIGGCDMAARCADPSIALSLRFTRFYDAAQDRLISAFDLLVGALTAMPGEVISQSQRMTDLALHRLTLQGQLQLFRAKAARRGR